MYVLNMNVSETLSRNTYLGVHIQKRIFVLNWFATNFVILSGLSSSPVSSQQRSHYSQHQKRASGNLQNSFLLVQNSSGESSADSHSLHQQQCLSQSLFDNSMFLLPTSTEDAMSGCSTNSSVTNTNFLQPAMPVYSQHQQQQHQSQSKHYNVHQSYNMSGTSKSSSNNSQMIHRQQQQQQPHAEHQHLILPPISSNNPGSSYVNFNLSTIFPEINFVNEKIAVHGLLPTQPAPISAANPSPSKSSVISTATSTEMRQLATPDLLPHSIAMLGHTTHQVWQPF